MIGIGTGTAVIGAANYALAASGSHGPRPRGLRVLLETCCVWRTL
jgi:hypothetical protein